MKTEILEQVTALSDEELRIKVAEICPHLFRCCRCAHNTDKSATLIRYNAPFCSDECAERAGDFATDDGQQTLRNYDFSSDLNAMHEAEDILHNEANGEQWNIFSRKLGIICRRSGDDPLHATARQRAEAFVQTLSQNDGGAGVWRGTGSFTK